MTVPINIAALTLETPATTSSSPASNSSIGRVAEGLNSPHQNENQANQKTDEKFDSMLKNHIDKNGSGNSENSNKQGPEQDADSAETEVVQTSQAPTAQKASEQSQLKPGLIALNQGAAEESTAEKSLEFATRLKTETPQRTLTITVADKHIAAPDTDHGELQTNKITKDSPAEIDSQRPGERLGERPGERPGERLGERPGERPAEKLGDRPIAGATQDHSKKISPDSENLITRQASKDAAPISQNVDTAKPTSAPLSATAPTEPKKPMSVTNPVLNETETASAVTQSKVATSGQSGKSLPSSGNVLPAANIQPRPQAPIETIPGLEQAMTKSPADALARVAGSATVQRQSAEKMPELPMDKSLLNTDLESLLRGQGSDASRSLVPTSETHPGIGKSLLNTRIETKTRRIGLGSPQAIEKSAVARPGIEKILANSAIPASELFSTAISQSSAISVTVDPAASSQSSSADTQTSTLLASYQTNTKQAVDAKSSLTLGLKADAPMPSTLTPGSRQWSNEIGSRIRWMSNSNVSSAKLSLHPAELGSLEILIASEDNQTRVNFITSNAAAKEVIESSLPRLRELLSESGLQLEQGDVTHQDSDRNNDSQNLPVNENTLAKENVKTETPQNSLPQFHRPSGNWQVDHYA